MNVLYLVNDDIYGGFWLNKHSCDDPPAPGLHSEPQGLLGAGGELEAGRGPGHRGGAQAEEGRGEQILDTGQLASL